MLVDRRFGSGETGVSEGEPGRSLFIVHGGELGVSKRTTAGASVLLNTLGEGDFFGEMTLIAMENRSATVTVEKAAVLFELSARSLYAFYKADVHAYVMILQ